MTRIFLVALGLICLPYLASAIVDEWTPEGFDWDSAFINDSIPNGLSMRLDEVPETTDLAYPLIQTDELGVQLVPIAAFFGIAYRVSTVAVAGISLKNTVETCQQTANKEATVYKCLEGVFGTAMAFGGAASASKRLGNQLRGVLFPHRFQTGGTAEIVCRVPSLFISPRAHKKRNTGAGKLPDTPTSSPRCAGPAWPQ